MERVFDGGMPFHTNQFVLGKRHWNFETSSAVVEFPPPYLLRYRNVSLFLKTVFHSLKNKQKKQIFRNKLSKHGKEFKICQWWRRVRKFIKQIKFSMNKLIMNSPLPSSQLFAASFPLATLITLAILLFDIRIDGKRLLRLARRSSPSSHKTLVCCFEVSVCLFYILFNFLFSCYQEKCLLISNYLTFHK